tara:strand:- start:1588 stop:2535 length:948 start_codon:yes stop_codon:yes gene_type:complete
MRDLNLLFIPTLFILTGCLGGVTVQKKDGAINKTSNTHELERVVHVDYGSQTEFNYDDDLSESIVSSTESSSTESSSSQNNEESSTSQEIEDNSSSSITSTIEESNSSTDQSEYCGIIYKKFNSDTYYLKSSERTFSLNLSNNQKYILDSNLNFPVDSGNICLSGTLSMFKGSKLFGSILGDFKLRTIKPNINVHSFTSTLIPTDEHPDREQYRNDYVQEFCGDVNLTVNKNTLKNIYQIDTHDGSFYNLTFSTKLGINSDDEEDFVFSLEDVQDQEIAISTGKFCFYSNSAPAIEFPWTAFRFIRVKYINGPWN